MSANIASSMAANTFHRQFTVATPSGLGGEEHRHLDRRGLALSGGHPRDLLTRGDWLGPGHPAHRGFGAGRPHYGTPAASFHDERLHHSGFGSQYAAARYQLMLTTHGITTNMSKRGSCWATPVLRVSSGRSCVNSSASGTTPPVKTRNEISSITFRDSTIGSVGAQHVAVIPQPSTKQGRLMKSCPKPPGSYLRWSWCNK
jgi:hypothetical protein